ncbi:MAG: hypothetical protein RQ985_04095 [Dehalococcoidia bacterium]|nr:hypothetical protein [Dehalococcoidia bacterium]
MKLGLAAVDWSSSTDDGSELPLAQARGDSTQTGLVAHIPLKGGGKPRDERRLSGRRHFHHSLYRLQGVVAGVSGAIKTRLAGGYLQEMLPSMAQKRAYLEAVVRGLAAAAPFNGLVTTLAL